MDKRNQCCYARSITPSRDIPAASGKLQTKAPSRRRACPFFPQPSRGRAIEISPAPSGTTHIHTHIHIHNGAQLDPSPNSGAPKVLLAGWPTQFLDNYCSCRRRDDYGYLCELHTDTTAAKARHSMVSTFCKASELSAYTNYVSGTDMPRTFV